MAELSASELWSQPERQHLNLSPHPPHPPPNHGADSAH